MTDRIALTATATLTDGHIIITDTDGNTIARQATHSTDLQDALLDTNYGISYGADIVNGAVEVVRRRPAR